MDTEAYNNEKIELLRNFKKSSSSELSFRRRSSILHLCDGLRDILKLELKDIFSNKKIDIHKLIEENLDNCHIQMFFVEYIFDYNYDFKDREKEFLACAVMEITKYY